MKFVKGVLVALLVIVALVVAAAAVFILTLDPKKFVSSLSEQLYQSYRVELKVDSARINILKGVEIGGLAVSKVGGFSNGTAIRTKDAGVIYNPVSLLNKEIDIIRLSMSGLEFGLEDALELYRTFASKTNAAGGAFKFVVRSVGVSESRFILNKVPMELKAEVLSGDIPAAWRIDASLSSSYGSARYEGSLESGSLSANGVRLNGFFKALPYLAFHSLQADVRRGGGDVYLVSGRTLAMSFQDFHIRAVSPFQASFDMGDQVLSVNSVDARLNTNNSLLVKNFTFDFKGKWMKLDVRDSALKLGSYLPGMSGDAAGPFTLAFHDGLGVSGDLAVSNFRYLFIEYGSGSVSLKDNAVSANLNLVIPGGALTVEATSAHFLNRPYDVRISAPSLDIMKVLRGWKSPEPAKDGEKKGAKFPAVNFTAKVDKAMFDRLPLDSIVLRGVFENGAIRLSSGEAGIFRGTLRASGDIANSVFTGNVSLSELRLRDFSAVYVEEPRKIFGTADIKASLRLALSDILGASGDITLDVKDGEFKDFVLQEKLGEFLYNIPLDHIQFDRIRLSAKLESGLARLTEAKFQSRDITIDAGGTVHLKNSNINLSADIGFSRGYLAELPNVAQILTGGMDREGMVHFKVRLMESLFRPRISFK